MKLVSVTQVYLVTKKIEPSLVAVLLLNTSQKSPSSLSLHLPFYSLVLLLGERSRKTFPQIHVHFVSGAHLSEPLLAPYLFWACPSVASGFSCSRKLTLFITSPKEQTEGARLKSSSLWRRFNEDSPLRHLLCPVVHGVGKKVTANDLGRM
ncbi:hypothetical protein AVEN_270742-1 [Araneus ventricosus]|uniref:Uncharacterized protein n=1 Tax=Araneus ventricosus TaxID=182803 RepID=A0A4Y2KTI7_ARAVE|nr:hypothetical protein AVEN_270742-1 [Araneus ventricosus]